MDLWVVFLTGLTTGGLTCLAVQGGLLATAITGQVRVDQPKGKGQAAVSATGVQIASNPWPVVYFLIAKLAAHTVLGFLLGALGSAFKITPMAQAIMQLVVGLFLVATALNMFNVHPVFRHVAIQPPKALTRLVKNQAKSQSVFAPALLGAMTVFIPCGTTQAMAVLAISSANPIIGAVVMAVFVLGTSPTFFVLGFLVTRLRGQLQRLFTLVTAALILFLGLLSLNGGLNLIGSPLAPERLLTSLFQTRGGPPAAQTVNGVQEMVINVNYQGYQPANWRAESGKPLRLRMLTHETYSCALAFTIPSLGLERMLPFTGETVIDLPPQPEGYLFFTCSMGMYSGTIRIEKEVSAS